MTKLEELLRDWNSSEDCNALQQVMALPVMQKALAIVAEDAKPSAPKNNAWIKGMPANDAQFHLARIFDMQTGIQSALDRLRGLTQRVLPTAPIPDQAPYAHIKPSYLEGESAE